MSSNATVSSKVLVTGASSGIGEATAYRFAAEGHDLFLVARRESRLAQVAERCRWAGAGQVLFEAHDLAIPGAGSVIVDNCLRRLGGLHILICNAGYGFYGPVAEILPQEMEQIWRVNYQSGYETIHRALPHFLQQAEGHIVLVSSIIGRKALPFSAPYCVTKSAQIALGEALHGELRSKGIGVTVVCPGFTSTEFHDSVRRRGSLPAFRRPVSGQDPQRVAKCILWSLRRQLREVHLTAPGKSLLFLNRLFPSLTCRLTDWFLNRQLSRSGRY